MTARDVPLRAHSSQQDGSKSVSEIYDMIGWGRYQIRLFVIAGLGFSADAIETGLISQLNKECPKTWTISDGGLHFLAGIVFTGELVGCAIWGPMADRVGRRKAFLVANVILLSFGILSAFAPSFPVFVLLRGIVGLAIGGIIIPFDNLSESVQDRYTVSVSLSLNYFWSAGSLMVALLSAVVLQREFDGIAPWRVLTALSALPIFLACLGYFFIEESPIWLQDAGRDEEALAVLQRIARTNGRDISGVQLVPYEREAEPSCSQVVSSRFRMRTLSLTLIWAGGVFGYFGASLAAPVIFGDGDGNTNYGPLVFGTSGEVLGVFICVKLCQRFGYMRTMGISYLTAAFFTATILAKDALPVPILAIFDFILRAGCMGGTSLMFVATPLAYPTYIRGTASGFHYAMGRFGAITASLLETAPLHFQLLLFVVANCIAGSISLFLGRGFEDQEELNSELGASVLERRESSFIKAQSRSFQMQERQASFQEVQMSPRK